MILVNIFSTIILPIFVLIGIGFVLDRAFHLDVQTLSKLGFYVFSPAIMLAIILRSDMQTSEMGQIALFTVAHAAVMYLIGMTVFSVRPFASHRTVMAFGSAFFNAGNYGFPLMMLAFGDWAVSAIAIVVAVQSILFFTVGLILFNGGHGGLRKALLTLLKMPTLYAIILAFALRVLHINLPPQIDIPLGYLVDAFIAVALLTLGVQLSTSRLGRNVGPIVAVSLSRLIFSPVVALGLVLLLRLEEPLADVMVVGAGLPVAVNVYLMATEFERDAELASLMVFWTTLLSALSVSILLSLVR